MLFSLAINRMHAEEETLRFFSPQHGLDSWLFNIYLWVPTVRAAMICKIERKVTW